MTDEPPSAPLERLADAARDLLREAARTYWTLVRVMVPVLIVVRLLQLVGVVEFLGRGLAPVMQLVGLPGSMGLVWATAMVVNLYTGMVVFASLAPANPLTVAQATVLCGMMLVAHGLLVELRIAQKAGPRIRAMAAIRLAGALLFGWLLHRFYTATGYCSGPSVLRFGAPALASSWWAWAAGLAKTLGAIFCIIVVLLTLLRVLDRVGLTDLLTKLLGPVLRLLGMGPNAAPVTIVGMTLGLTLGGGLIIQEARSGRLSKRDVFFSLALMSLCHSLIEDTMLMALLGAHWSGTLVGRLAFALLAVFILTKLAGAVSEDAFDRFLVRAPDQQ